MSFEIYTNRSALSIRREKLNGRSFIVAPAVLLVPGVLKGSRGAMLYPKDEVTNNVSNWNNMPITLGHPTNGEGKHVSARSPAIMSEYSLGFVYNASDKDDKLSAELWFDEELVQSKSPELLGKLERGDTSELSTGLFVDQKLAANGEMKGKSYQFVARKYRPDHLAILLGEKGACSREDGCGLNVNESDAAEILPEGVTFNQELLQEDGTYIMYTQDGDGIYMYQYGYEEVEANGYNKSSCSCGGKCKKCKKKKGKADGKQYKDGSSAVAANTEGCSAGQRKVVPKTARAKSPTANKASSKGRRPQRSTATRKTKATCSIKEATWEEVTPKSTGCGCSRRK